MRYAFQQNSEPIRLITLDVDWAQDVVIEYVARLLIEAGVKATWLVTHRSAAIDALRGYPDLFELGVHPNFSEGSTQGESVDEVIEYCRGIVPDADSVRTHRLVQSTPIYKAFLEKTQWKYDLSTLMPYAANLTPARFELGGASLWKVPFYWEDDVHFSSPQPDWNIKRKGWGQPGLQIYTFHPGNIFHNAKNLEEYHRNIRSEACEPAADEDVGTRYIFCNLLRELQADSRTIRELFVEDT